MQFLCGKTCQYITRIVFLIFIIIVTCYFFWLNDKEESRETKKASKESFAQQPSDPTKTMIADIYKDLYQRPPTDRETQFYSDYVSYNPNITRAQLADVIESTSPEMAKTLQSSDPSMEIISAKDPEQVVIEAYSEVLFRMPSPTELKKYADMLRADPKFTRDRLVMVLMSTPEYDRMEKTQTNVVYSNLPGGVTDRQVTMTIEEINRQVTGESYIDPDTMRFYKRKFLEMNNDEVKFKLFLERYVMWTSDSPVQSATTLGISPTTSAATAANPNKSTSTTVAKTSTSNSNTTTDLRNATTTTTTAAKPSEAFDDSSTDTASCGASYTNSTVYNIYTVGSTDYLGMPNKAIIDNISGKCAKTTDQVVKSITCQTGTIKSKDNPSTYSDFIQERNREELRSTCARTKKFTDIDEEDQYAAMFYTNTFSKEDMVLDPSLRWSVPQRQPPICAPNGRCNVSPLSDQTALIGTPIEQSKDTKWGSILPPLPP